MSDEREITVSNVATYVFCPRKLWLTSNGHDPHDVNVVRGATEHDAVDNSSKPMSVHDPAIGLHGTCDSVSIDENIANITEYKSSSSDIPVIREHVIVQLAAYRHCLTAQGYVVRSAAVWWTTHGYASTVSDFAMDVFNVPELTQKCRGVMASDTSPPVLEDDPRCAGCSLVEACQPSEELVSNPRIVPSRRDDSILIVDADVRRVSTSKGHIKLDGKDGGKTLSAPIGQVSGMVVLNTHAIITTQAILALIEDGKYVVYGWGKPQAFTSPVKLPNGHSRARLAAADSSIRKYLASKNIHAKVHNQASRVRALDPSAARAIRGLRDDVTSIDPNLPEDEYTSKLFGLEGGSATLYFSVVISSLPTWATSSQGRFPGTGVDPFNAATDYAYGMLNGTVTRAVLACGLDPSAGVLHSSSRNKPAIVLDLMEPFRAPVADSVVRNLFTQGTLKKNDFMFLRGKVSLKQSGRRALSGAYNEFLDNKHNYLGSGKLSWERSIEYVVRAMVRFIDGSSDTWESVYVK